MNWRLFFRREYADSEQRQELESYLEIAADEFVSRGMSRGAARHAARVKLGNPTLVQEQIYAMNTSKLLDFVVRTSGIRAGPCGETPLSRESPS